MPKPNSRATEVLSKAGENIAHALEELVSSHSPPKLVVTQDLLVWRVSM